MLVEFSVANYRSINKKCTLSMMAQGIADEPKENIASLSKLRVLKTAAIYGANSSGKTNVVRAIAEMVENVLMSVKLNDDESLSYDPFMLSSNSKNPTFFELVFLIGNKKYRYGFELTSLKIHKEWLFSSSISSKSEKLLFGRNEDGIGVDEKNFPEGKNKEENTNDNRLFLSLCAQLGGRKSKEILRWFKENINIISGIHSREYMNFSKVMLHKDLDGCEQAKELFNKLRLGFLSLETKEVELDIDRLPADMPDNMKTEIVQHAKGKKIIDLLSKHNIYDINGNVVDERSFDVDEMESEGTKKLIQLSGPIFNTLIEGNTLVIDELDAKMHPLISHYIIDLFNDPEKNPKNAQLVFTTHDTHLLSSKLLRRDQIWFTEKDSTEQTDLYNMMDIILPDGSKPRNDANYERNYIAGRYGAIPYIINE